MKIRADLKTIRQVAELTHKIQKALRLDLQSQVELAKVRTFATGGHFS
jgi:hypothetical protein